MKNYVFVGQDSVFFCSKLSVTISNPDFFVETESARNGLKALYILACEFSDGSSNGSLYFQKPFGKGRYIEFHILHKQEHQPQYILDRAEHQIIKQYGMVVKWQIG